MTLSTVLSVTLCALSVGAAPSGPAGPLVDRVVAVVDKQVITLSELLVETRVTLVYKGGESAASADLDEQLLRTFADYVVNQTLVAMQARRLGAAEVSEVDVEHELWRFAQQFRTNDAYRAFLRRFDISDEVLRHIAQRNLRNDKYIAERMRLRLGERDATVDSPRYQEALKKWLTEVRQSAEVRLLGPTGELELQGTEPAPAPSEAGRP